ncbi:CREB-regulated transcription coactivator 3-like isoform X3 [Acipenser ruthenus]|uniref:CREB-regulated transcription coactivator 3-like isoform X3 n=1 Tax=Acipenser ruthenus TaxID=7906 RepID=UPI00145AFF5E|nr:CREB-regulated transcription coactivator 3-like isoform X3 [Acipenser ruthenus]
MAGSPGSGGTNPRKFSEKIALHNQKQAEETRAFEQLMTDITLSRVQFQKVQQLQLTQTRAQYYGGSLPNVNQIGNTSADFQGSFTPGLDSMRGTRHHGLVERVSRDRSRLNSPHRRLADKLGRQVESSPYGSVYLSPPPDNSWRREQPSWSEEKRPGFRLLSQLNRTNSDSALHTSALNPNPQDPFVGMNQQMSRAPPQRNVSVNEAEIDGMGDVFSFPALANEESLMGVSKPLPKQLWEAKKVQSLSSRPKSCEVPGINIFPSPEQNAGLSHFQGTLNTGGSLPDLTNLHFPSPLPTPLDPEDGGYPSLSGGSSTGNLPAAMMHLGIGNSQGLSSSLSNPSIQATLNNSQLHSSLSNPSIHSSLRLSSLSNPQQGALSNTPRRRHTPVSPLTLSPGAEQRRGLGMQLSPTMSPSLSPITQGVSLDTSSLPMEPPPPYHLYQQSQQSLQQQQQQQQQQQSHQPIQQSSQRSSGQQQQQQQQQQQLQQQQQQQQLQQQPVASLHNLHMDLNSNANHNSLGAFFYDPFMDTQLSGRQSKSLSYQQLDQFNMLENSMSSLPGGSCFDPGSNLCYSQASLMGLGGSHGDLQESLQLRQNMFFSNCGGGIPNIILTDESNPSLSKDISSALAGVPECFDSEGEFLGNELRIEPLSLDGLSMLSDPDMVLPDPSVEDSFRSDRL